MTQLKQLMKEHKMNRRTARAIIRGWNETEWHEPEVKE